MTTANFTLIILAGMNLNLSEEQELIVKNLLQHDPCQVDSLATVIWDSLSYIGINDVNNSFGIYFTKQATPEVVLWEFDSSVKLPRRAFLEVLELAAEYTLEATSNQDISRLKRALKNLKQEIAHLKSFGESLQYYYTTDDSFEDAQESIEAIEGTRFAWLEGLQDTSMDNVKTLSSGGLEGKTAYQAGKDGAFASYSNQIRSKLKAFNVFRTILGTQDHTEEEM